MNLGIRMEQVPRLIPRPAPSRQTLCLGDETELSLDDVPVGVNISV
jgi:hypothetical protein